jgi:hypothetical protein
MAVSINHGDGGKRFPEVVPFFTALYTARSCFTDSPAHPVDQL